MALTFLLQSGVFSCRKRTHCYPIKQTKRTFNCFALASQQVAIKWHVVLGHVYQVTPFSTHEHLFFLLLVKYSFVSFHLQVARPRRQSWLVNLSFRFGEFAVTAGQLLLDFHIADLHCFEQQRIKRSEFTQFKPVKIWGSRSLISGRLRILETDWMIVDTWL